MGEPDYLSPLVTKDQVALMLREAPIARQSPGIETQQKPSCGGSYDILCILKWPRKKLYSDPQMMGNTEFQSSPSRT